MYREHWSEVKLALPLLRVPWTARRSVKISLDFSEKDHQVLSVPFLLEAGPVGY